MSTPPRLCLMTFLLNFCLFMVLCGFHSRAELDIISSLPLRGFSSIWYVSSGPFLDLLRQGLVTFILILTYSFTGLSLLVLVTRQLRVVACSRWVPYLRLHHHSLWLCVCLSPPFNPHPQGSRTHPLHLCRATPYHMIHLGPDSTLYQIRPVLCPPRRLRSYRGCS